VLGVRAVEQGEVPEVGVDFDRPNAARMYDYMLRGAHDFAVDRELVDQVLAVNPGARRAFEANRAFLGRVVRGGGD